jgi:hypothetical protein
MVISQDEIQERWLAGCLVAGGTEALVETFNRVEATLGREWLEAPLAGPTRGPIIALPLHLTGQHLRSLANAVRREKLVERLRVREPAALSELHALAICVGDDPAVDVEIEPTIQVNGGDRVPDFAVRRGSERWTYVEVTAPNESEDAEEARAAATTLVKSLPPVPSGVAAHVRFRDVPTEDDIQEVGAELRKATVGTSVDQGRFVLEVTAAADVTSISGSDEQNRPIYGSMAGRVEGDVRSSIMVRVPYTDERGQRILDAEAKQIRKGGPGLICMRTANGKYWRGLIERSFSPTIRRRISGALLFFSGITGNPDGAMHLPTIGRLLSNPHARTHLPDWLRDRLERLPAKFQ